MIQGIQWMVMVVQGIAVRTTWATWAVRTACAVAIGNRSQIRCSSKTAQAVLLTSIDGQQGHNQAKQQEIFHVNKI